MISSVVRTVLVYLAVVVAMRLMGKRQLGELQPAELVTTLLISKHLLEADLQRRIHLHRRAGSTALGQPGADFLNYGS